MHYPGRNAIANFTVMVCALGARNPSIACSINRRPKLPEPNLEMAIRENPVVFIGTVVHTDGMPTMLTEYPTGGRAKFKVENSNSR